MSPIVGLALAALCLGSTGCALVHDSASLATFKMRESAQDFCEGVRNRQWARETWADIRRANQKVEYSRDYEDGFKDGFEQYLYRGGNCEPPPLPPKRYRTVRFQTPWGYQAIQNWFDGFRHGAAVARDSGYRDWITGPSALRAECGPPAEWEVAEPAPPIGIDVLPPPTPTDTPLPPPTPVQPNDGDNQSKVSQPDIPERIGLPRIIIATPEPESDNRMKNLRPIPQPGP